MSKCSSLFGTFWSKTPPPSPSSGDYQSAIQGIITGLVQGVVGQYRGVGPGTLIYAAINDSSDPTN